MKKKQIGNWVIEYDQKATKNAYSNIPDGITCECPPCRNYKKAFSDFPSDVHLLFDELGVDISKPGELMYYTVENGIANMGGWYHIVGNSIPHLKKVIKINH